MGFRFWVNKAHIIGTHFFTDQVAAQIQTCELCQSGFFHQSRRISGIDVTMVGGASESALKASSVANISIVNIVSQLRLKRLL
jgi:hypothetical protein